MNFPVLSPAIKSFPLSPPGNLAKAFIIAVCGSLLLTVSAKVQIPLEPLRISMQSFVVILLGTICGPWLALATVSLYLLQGAVGLPVFQGTPEKGIGLAYMVGPTGGYLLGFLASTWAAGMMARKGMGNTLVSAAVLFTVASALIDVFGLTWLAYFVGVEGAKTVYFSYQLAFLLKMGLFSAVVPLLRPKYPL